MSDVLDEDSAEIAFAALGLKVDGLSVQLARLEKLCRRQTVDYAPTLAKVSDDIYGLKQATVALGTSPALKLTNDAFRQEAEQVRAKTRADMERDLQATRDELEAAAREVRISLASARNRRKQDWRLAQMGILSSALGVSACVFLSGPLARALPRSWALPEKIATIVLPSDEYIAPSHVRTAPVLTTKSSGRLSAARRHRTKGEQALINRIRVDNLMNRP